MEALRLYRHRIAVVVVLWWFIIAVLGATIGIRFLHLPKVDMNPSAELPGLKALKKLYQHFPEAVQRQSMVVLVDCVSALNANCTGPEMESLVGQISGLMNQQLPQSRVQQYFKYSSDPLLDELAEQFISRETSSLLVLIEYRGFGLDQRLADAIHKQFGKSDMIKTHGANVRATSAALVHKQVGASVLHSMVDIDVWTIPLACGLLFLVFRSWRMLVLVVMNVAVAVLSGWLAMYSLCTALDLGIDHVTTVEFMHMIVVVLALDYSLFMLTTVRSHLQGEGDDADWVAVRSHLGDGADDAPYISERSTFPGLPSMSPFSQGVLGSLKESEVALSRTSSTVSSTAPLSQEWNGIGSGRFRHANRLETSQFLCGPCVPQEGLLVRSSSSPDNFVSITMDEDSELERRRRDPRIPSSQNARSLEGPAGPRVLPREDARAADSAAKPALSRLRLDMGNSAGADESKVALASETSWTSSYSGTTNAPSPSASRLSDSSSAQHGSDKGGSTSNNHHDPMALTRMDVAAAMALRLNYETILSSACALAAVFLGFLLLDNDRLRINGIASAVGALVVAFVVLSLTPAMLVMCPSFFSRGFYQFKMARCLQLMQPPSSYWKLLGSGITTWPFNAIIILLAFCALSPLALNANDLRTNMNQWMLTSRDNEEHATWVAALARFSPGLIEPSSVLLCIERPQHNNATYQYDLLLSNLARVAAHALIAEDLLPRQSIVSMGFNRGFDISNLESNLEPNAGFHWLKDPRDKAESLYQQDIMNPEINADWFSTSSAGQQCTLMKLLQPHFPSDWPARSWNDRVRNTLERSMESQASHNEVFRFCGGRTEPHLCDFQISSALWNAGIVEQDQEYKEWRSFVQQFGITIALVMLLTMVMLRSLLISLRLGVTMVIPLLAVYGLAAKVYQDGLLAWTQYPSLGGSIEGGRLQELESGSFYEPMVMLTLTCCFALALDYDLFLLWRIRWHRINRGEDHRSSIILALHETGPTINWAGVIMATTFGGNLLGRVMLFNQAAWLIASSVLIDAFVVRTVLVPSICSFAPDLMWWPSYVPAPLQDDLGVLANERENGMRKVETFERKPRAAE